MQLAANLLSPMPLAVSRFRSQAMNAAIDRLLGTETFDSIVCDFLFPAPNFSTLHKCILFQHNVETMIWRRQAETARGARRILFKTQAERMFRYEREVCRKVRHIIAVSDQDADRMKELFDVDCVSTTPTGVDTNYFAPPKMFNKTTDIVFVGSMDWMANIDGVLWFAEQVLPRIRARRPDTTVSVVGRTPTPPVIELGKRDPNMMVTGTVADVRPYFWQSKLCVVPLRVGGGTRLKIYEAMAARIPVVSTTIGAEGLAVGNQRELLIADTPECFAEACIALLESSEARERLSDAAWQLVSSRFSWEQVTDRFEDILRTHSVR